MHNNDHYTTLHYIYTDLFASSEMQLVIYYQLLLLLHSPLLVQLVEGWTRTARAHEHDVQKSEHKKESSSSSSVSTTSRRHEKGKATSEEYQTKKASSVSSSLSSTSPSSYSRTKSEIVEDIVVTKKQLIDFFNTTYISKIQAKIDKKTNKAFAGFYGWYVSLFLSSSFHSCVS